MIIILVSALTPRSRRSEVAEKKTVQTLLTSSLYSFRIDRKKDKTERKILDSQERAFWDVHRPVVRKFCLVPCTGSPHLILHDFSDQPSDSLVFSDQPSDFLVIAAKLCETAFSIRSYPPIDLLGRMSGPSFKNYALGKM